VLDNQWGFLLWLEEKPNVPEGSVHVMCPPALCSQRCGMALGFWGERDLSGT